LIAIIKLTYEVNDDGGVEQRLKVEFKNKYIEKICTNASVAEKKYGSIMAEKIQLRIDQLTAADSVEQLVRSFIGRCHPLRHNRKNQYAMDLEQPKRLVFEVIDGETQIANIIEITDYHR